MKKILSTLTLILSFVFASVNYGDGVKYVHMVQNFLSNQNMIKNKVSNSSNIEQNMIDEELGKDTNMEESSSKVNINSLLVKKYINNKNCDEILNNDGYFITCYDNKLKSPIYGYAKIDGSLVNKKNIKKRPRFYEDLHIPKKYRTRYSDYTRSGFDRSHQFSDASFDWSKRSQLATYTMSNVLPHYPNTNRKSILAVEKYERYIASKLGTVEVLVIHNFPKHPKRIGRSRLAVPESMDKVFFNKSKGFQKCFRIPNDNVIYTLKDMKISCKEVLR